MKTFVYIDGFNLYYAIRNTGCKWLNIKKLAEAAMPAGTVIERVKYYTARVSGAADPGQPMRQQVYFKALATLPEVEVFFGNFLAKAQWRPLLNVPVADRHLNGGGDAVKLDEKTYTIGLDPVIAGSVPESLRVGKYGNNGGKKKPSALPDAVKVQVFGMEEKGSDVNLAVHLVNDAWAKRFEAAVVISNDTDLVEPIRIVSKELGLPVCLLSPPTRFGCAPKPLAAVSSSVRHINRSHLNTALFPDPLPLADGTTLAKPVGW